MFLFIPLWCDWIWHIFGCYVFKPCVVVVVGGGGRGSRNSRCLHTNLFSQDDAVSENVNGKQTNKNKKKRTAVHQQAPVWLMLYYRHGSCEQQIKLNMLSVILLLRRNMSEMHMRKKALNTDEVYYWERRWRLTCAWFYASSSNVNWASAKS